MNWRYLWHTILIIIFSLIQIGLISSFPNPFNHLDLILIILIFLHTFDDINLLFFWLILTSFILSLTSITPFGIEIFATWFTILISYFLFTQILTNKSLYSLIVITASMTLVKQIFIYLFIGGARLFTETVYYSMTFYSLGTTVFYAAILNLIGMIAIYYSIGIFNPKLKPYILFNKR